MMLIWKLSLRRSFLIVKISLIPRQSRQIKLSHCRVIDFRAIRAFISELFYALISYTIYYNFLQHSYLLYYLLHYSYTITTTKSLTFKLHK